MKKNIVLIGMPGAGKSTIGVLLAKTLCMPFLDTDLLIQQSEGKLLQDIINDSGIEAFQTLEEKTIINVVVEGHVISTGGSAVYSHEAMKHLKKNGIVVYLKLKYYQIERRIKNISSRGIVMGKDQNLQALYDERTPLYEEFADMTLDCSGKHIETVITEIKDKIGKYIF